MTYRYKTKGTCSRSIFVDVSEDGTINDVKFEGGCHGNTQGVAALVIGSKAQDIIPKIKNIDCGGRGTSCPDQLAKALEAVLEQM